MGTLWELDRNTLGFKEEKQKITPHTLPSKGEKQGPS